MRYPGANITWVINPEFAPLLRGNPDVDHIHFFPRGEFRGLGAPAKFEALVEENEKTPVPISHSISKGCCAARSSEKSAARRRFMG